MHEIMKQIRRGIESRHISQRSFADLIGVGEVTVNRWMNGHRFPALDNLDKMTQVLGLEITIHKRNPRWLHENDDKFDWLVCSECGYGDEGEVFIGMETPFCPMCGARLAPPKD